MKEVTLDPSTFKPIPQKIPDKVDYYASIYEVPQEIASALAEQESGFNPRAVSNKGAMGVMQLMPETAKSIGVNNPFDPDQNISGGLKYLKDLHSQFGDWNLALAAYNAGPSAIERYGGIPPFQETQNYVQSINAKLAKNSMSDVELLPGTFKPISQPTPEISDQSLSDPFDQPNPVQNKPPLKLEGAVSSIGGDPSKTEAFLRGVENMASLGLAKHARALEQQRLSGGSFQDALKAIENRDRTLEYEYPGYYIGGQGVGSIAGPAKTAFKTISRIVAPKAANILTRGLATGIAGAALDQTQAPSDASLSERATRAAINIPLGLAGEAVATGIGRSLQLAKGGKVPGQFADDINVQAIEANEILKKRGLEIPLSPSDMASGRGKGSIEAIFQASPFSRETTRKFGLKQQTSLDRVASWLEQRVGIEKKVSTGLTGIPLESPGDLVNESEVAAIVSKKLFDAEGAFKNASNELYDTVNRLAPDGKFFPSETIKAINSVKKEFSFGVKDSGPVGDFLKKFSSKFIKNKKQADLSAFGLKPVQQNELTFQNLQAVRRDLNDYIENARIAGNQNQARLLNIIKSAVDEDISGSSETVQNAFLSQGRADAAQALKAANSFYRENKQKFSIDLLKEVMDLAKDQRSVRANKVISDAIRNGEWEQIRKLKNVVGEDDFQPIRQSFIQKLLRGKQPESYNLTANNWKTESNPLRQRLYAIKPEVLKEMVGDEDALILKALADISPYAKSAVQAQQDPRALLRTSASLIPFASGLGAVAAGGGTAPVIAAGAASIVANNLLAKAWYSEPVRGMILSGYKPGMKTQELKRLAQIVFGSLLQNES